MKKYILKLQSFFKRKGYQESPVADEIFTSVEPDFNSTEHNTFTGSLPVDVITELKKAQREVQEFELTLKSIKQNTTV